MIPGARSRPILPLLLLSAACAQLPGEADSGDEAPITRGAAMNAAAHHDSSPPLTLMPAAERRETNPEHEVKAIPRHFNTSAVSDPVRQSKAPALLAPTVGLSFNGVGQGFSGPSGTFSVAAAPPDTNGDVGPNHYVQTVNTDFAIFNKSGTAIYGPVPINTLWSGFGGGCQTNNDGDPVVSYDPIADRWVISQFSVTTTPYLQCVAVSQTPDPTGAYNRYSFSYASAFPDYPKMGVWPDAYYVTFNIFNNGSTFAGAKICAYDRAKMLTGAAATQQCFNTSTAFGGLLPADLDGSTLPPAGAPNYILGLGSAANQLAYWKFHVDWTTPANSTFTGPTTLATATFAEACGGATCIKQSGTTQTLDSLADRLMFRLAYRNFGDHEALLVNHSVTSGTGTGVRWYELRVGSGSTLSIFQQSTYAPDANYRWMGSAAFDHVGNIGLGFSLSGSTLHPEIHYTGRLAGDAAGTMTQGENSIIDGAGSQTGSSLSRWGDYSNMVVDPSDDCTFWFTTEYIPANGAFNWATRIGTFKLPGCGATASNDFSLSASPTTVAVTAGGSGTSTISTAVTSGSAQSVALSVSGVPSGASASFSPSSVTAGGSSTLTLNSGSAAAGTYALTVTGTGASATHSTSLSFTINPVVTNDFSIAASPTTVTVTAGGNGSSTISTATTSGSAQSVSLSASGVPAGATASFSPASVTSGGSSTLTLASGSAAAGSYSITITGTGASATHTTSVSFVINAVVSNDFSVSASPSSLTLVQGTAGSSTISTAVTSGSAQTISLSVSGVPSGATASFSPTSITAGGSSTLSVNAGTAAAGSYTLTISAAGTSTTHTTSVGLSVTSSGGGGGNVLQNGVPVTGIAGASNSQTNYTMAVPAGQATLSFKTSGGTGDSDLYVKFGSAPTLSSYDCRPYTSTTNETCSFTSPAAGTWYVMIVGYSAYSGVSLVGTFGADTTPALTSGVPVTGISGATGSQQFWKLTVPAGKTTLTFKISGGTGDADLYVRKTSKPTTSTYDCRPYLVGNSETCTFSSPTATDYYVMLNGYAAYSGVSLTGTYSP